MLVMENTMNSQIEDDDDDDYGWLNDHSDGC